MPLDKGQTGDGRRRSHSGIVLLLNACACLWKSQVQKSVSVSTCESELIALSQTTQEVIYVRRLLQFLGFTQAHATVIYEDNTAAEAIAVSDLTTKRSRFIDTRHFFCKEIQNFLPITYSVIEKWKTFTVSFLETFPLPEH